MCCVYINILLFKSAEWRTVAIILFDDAWQESKSIYNLINAKSSRIEIVRANKIEENVAMINEIRGAIEAKFYDWTVREWRTVELVIGNSLWWNYTEEGVCVIMLKLTCSDESSPLGYTNRINLNCGKYIKVHQINESTKIWLNVLHFYSVNAKYQDLTETDPKQKN